MCERWWAAWFGGWVGYARAGRGNWGSHQQHIRFRTVENAQSIERNDTLPPGRWTNWSASKQKACAVCCAVAMRLHSITHGIGMCWASARRLVRCGRGQRGFLHQHASWDQANRTDESEYIICHRQAVTVRERSRVPFARSSNARCARGGAGRLWGGTPAELRP